MHDKFLNFLLKLIHLCQKMSRFSYREVSRGRLQILDHLWRGPIEQILWRVGLRTKRTPGKTLLECTMHDKFSNILLKLIHLCQKMSRFSYREVLRGRLENIGPPLEGAD